MEFAIVVRYVVRSSIGESGFVVLSCVCVCSSVLNFVLEGFLVLYRQERRGFSSEVEGGDGGAGGGRREKVATR